MLKIFISLPLKRQRSCTKITDVWASCNSSY